MPKYTTKYGVVTLGPLNQQYHLEPAANVPPEPAVDTSQMPAECLGVEGLAYTTMQSQYHRFGRSMRHGVANCFKEKKMRDTIIGQVYKMQDPQQRDEILYKYSPALLPDLRDAPPDVPEYATLLLAVMEQIAQRDGLDTDVLHGCAVIPEDHIWACYDLEPPESVKKIKEDAFAEGAAYVRQLHADLTEKRKADVEALAAPPDESEFSVYGTTRTLLRQAIAKRVLDDAEEEEKNKDRPSKRARYDNDSSSDGDGDGSGDSDDDGSVRAPSLDLDMDVDVDDAYNPQDAGAGTGMLPAPRAYIDTYSAKHSRPRDWERLWHELPYETRIHTLGPGMTRQNLLPDDEFTLAHRPVSSSSSPGKNKTALYKGKGTRPRFATLEEALREAPDDYEGCAEIFDWEVQHGRAAPAVLPHQQKLPVVPFHAGSRLRPTNAYDPTEPQDSRRPRDDQWENVVTVYDAELGRIVKVEIQADGTAKRVSEAMDGAATTGSGPAKTTATIAVKKTAKKSGGAGGGGKKRVKVAGGQYVDDNAAGDGAGAAADDGDDDDDDDGDGNGNGNGANDQTDSGLSRLLYAGRDMSVWLWKKSYLGRRLNTG